MAYELAVYESERKIVVHTSLCPTYSTVEREFQTTPIVNVPEGWRVVKCPKCNPHTHTVNSIRVRIHVNHPAIRVESPTQKIERDGHYGLPLTKHSADKSFPPYGLTALDITHSQNREHWWSLANCRSKDERLSGWLEWLFMAVHTEHWTLTVQKVMCAECPVRAECLEQGVWGNELWGVWGGANERERKLLRQKWKREGRVDERPNRPRNPDFYVRSKNGSRVAATGGDDRVGVDETPRQGESTSETVQGVSSGGGEGVRWPGAHVVTGDGWEGDGAGDW